MREEDKLRDIFRTNKLGDDVQRELLHDTVDQERALSIRINMGIGHQNQQRISSKNKMGAKVVQQFTRFAVRMHNRSKETEIASTVKPHGIAEIVENIGHQINDRFAWLRIRSVITVGSSITSRRYFLKNKTQTKTHNTVIE